MPEPAAPPQGRTPECAARRPSDEPAGALLALWNDVDPALAQDYEAWHAFEHVPERCTVPGILWGWRFARQAGPRAEAEIKAMPQYLTLYGLRDAQVLDSAPYQRLLRDPTPMSRRMRPALQQVSRWVCDVSVNTLDHGVMRLLVWTALDESDTLAHTPMAPRVPSGRLSARRRVDAAPLPWLHPSSGPTVDGAWLVGAVPDSALSLAAEAAHSTLYHRLQGGSPGAVPDDR